ncbi:alpha/beta hydrolase [Mangrovihabitans endophyticus]|uniref:Peptidase n=1 Tax=Mangrovihabitans endophyticus TaxID=1751298 RepID=A0A8J3BWI4_9ACTN|nr:alpha/beta hydrolase [Mangrovihabitans endophyticus]GGK80927.1 peptidase [Mangrovihabitans endophyticus]
MPSFALTVSAVLLSATALAAAPARADPSTLDWQSCAANAAAQCASLRLPADWADPRGPSFDLAVARLPATDPAERIGTLVFGPGGPGDSGVRWVTGGATRFQDDIRRRFDILSFDPRGVGGSNPVVCPPDPPGEQPAPVLTSQADFDARLAYNRRRWARCRAMTGPVFDHADTAGTVRDLEALRVALGESTLTFHGSSYGNVLGEQYAERYPNRVRAMVLESVTDHGVVGTAGFLRTQAWAQQDAFDDFVGWCDAHPECALHGRDVRAVWADLLSRARAGTLGLTPFDLVVNLLRDTRDPDYARLAETMADPSGAIRGLPPLNDAAFCGDWSLPVRDYRDYAAQVRRATVVAPDLPYPAAVFAPATCLGWPQPPANPQHRLRVRTAVPLLLLNARHDPATGLNWATDVARQLGDRGVLVVYQGAGHGAYSLSDCMRRIADRYLIERVVPRRGTACAAVTG